MASSINASTSGAGGVITTADNTGILNLQTAGTTAVTVDASQNVSVPAGYLFVGGGVTNYGSIYLNSTTTVNPQIRENAGAIAFLTNSSERMRIDSSGNLLVNSTTSPSGSGNAFINGVVYIGTTNADPTFNRVNGFNLLKEGALYARANSSWDLGRNVTSGIHISFYTDNGSARVTAGNISSNGTTTAYNTASDYRLKENVITLSNALETITQLKPVKWTWKDGFGGTKTEGQGFIAHELQEVVPDCVVGDKDAVDEEGNPVYQGVDTSFLVATLTAAIQEQQTIINDLKARVTALEAK
jgi:hypothetical protein